MTLISYMSSQKVAYPNQEFQPKLPKPRQSMSMSQTNHLSDQIVQELE